MPYWHWYWNGCWIFPIVMPIAMLIIAGTAMHFLSRAGFRPPYMGMGMGMSDMHPPTHDDETAVEILNRRYAKGEITKQEHEQMKVDLEA